MQMAGKRGTLRIRDGWLICECGAKLMEVRSDTRADHLPVYCRHCKRKYTVNIGEARVLETTAQ